MVVMVGGVICYSEAFVRKLAYRVTYCGNLSTLYHFEVYAYYQSSLLLQCLQASYLAGYFHEVSVFMDGYNFFAMQSNGKLVRKIFAPRSQASYLIVAGRY